MLQEAAFELFLEQTYARTTIDQIAQRAGVSRNTFFNYFSAKSDVFWVDLDESLALFGSHLSSATAPMQSVMDAVLLVARDFGPSRVPWALTHHDLIGSVHELQASAMTRLAGQARVLTGYLSLRSFDASSARAASYSVLGATVAAALDWANAGSSRGDLAPYLQAALGPVCAGWASALPPKVANHNGT